MKEDDICKNRFGWFIHPRSLSGNTSQQPFFFPLHVFHGGLLFQLPKQPILTAAHKVSEKYRRRPISPFETPSETTAFVAPRFHG